MHKIFLKKGSESKLKYEKVVEGIFLKRPNRFIAHVLIRGKEEIAHVKNTSRCRELLIPGAKLYLEDKRHILGRKTKYSVISVYKGDTLINIDSQVPNEVVSEALMANKISLHQDVDFLKREVVYGQSRFDIYMERGQQKCFIEVKGVTLERDRVAAFPDAPTERGARHVREMMDAVQEGYHGIIFFLVKMQTPDHFTLNRKMDPVFADAVCQAQEKGVEILAYDAAVSRNEIWIGKKLPIKLDCP